MRTENLKNLIEGLQDVSILRMEINELRFFIQSEPVDFNELACQIFDDTGLQDVIESQSMSEHFSPASCRVLIAFEEKFNEFVRGLSKNEAVGERLEELRISAKTAVETLIKLG